MKIDFHIHLEEGPYGNDFFSKTVSSIYDVQQIEGTGTLEDIERKAVLFQQRMEQGDYSEWWLDFYLEEAVNKGLKYVGIVDHLYRFVETMSYFKKYMDVESEEIGRIQLDWLERVAVHRMSDFVDFIQSQQQKWHDRGVQLMLGIEADYFEGGEEELTALLEPYDFDYIIGSVHFNKGWGFDNPVLQHLFEEKDLVELYRSHFHTVKKAAASGIFSFIAHLDNLKVFNYRPDEQHLLPMYREIAEALKNNDVATEINVGLKYRYPVKEQCPSEQFIRILKEYDVPFTTSSDSHFPNDIGIFNNEIHQLLKHCNISEIVRFRRMERIVEKLK